MPSQPASKSILPVVFFVSGIASLIDQVIWQRLLTLYYGVGSVSITLIVSVYMLGLGFGALLGGRLAERVKNPITLYLLIELALGLFGLVSLPYLDLLGRHTAGSPYWVSLGGMFLFLSLPTFLMGMTLPVIVKAFNAGPGNFESSVSFLYFLNTLGAALGALLASYGIISFLSLDTGIALAAAVNFTLAGWIYFPYRRLQNAPAPASDFVARETAPDQSVYFWVFVTGFLAIGYEIIWFRIVEVLVKASPYAFSSVLFVYLSGIALGACAMKGFLKKHPRIDQKSLFFFLQWAIGLYVLVSILGYYQLTQHTRFKVFTESSFWQILHPPATFPDTGSRRADLFILMDILIWPSFFFFVPTLCMGASFPLISKLALFQQDKEGQAVGSVYFFLSLGNVAGGLLTGFFILPFFGTEPALFAFGVIGLFLGMGSFQLFVKAIPRPFRFALICGLIGLFFPFFPKRSQLYGAMHSPPEKGFTAFIEEGMEGVVVTYQKGEKISNYINGLGHGGRPGYEFFNEVIEVSRFAGKVENVLIVGFGTGSITEAVAKLEDVKSITVVELNGTLMKNLKKMAVFRDILSDPRIHFVVDDGRRFLARTSQRFDLVLMDPLRTTTVYSNNLYSQQFFQQVSRSLEDRGIFMVWMDEYRVMPKTIASVFKHLRFYGSFALASNSPFLERKERAERLLARFSEPVREEILHKRKRCLGDETYVLNLTQGYPVNQDRKPVCEYYLGLKARGTSHL